MSVHDITERCAHDVEAHAALRGIATYAAAAGQILAEPDSTLDPGDVLRHIEQHARAVLDGTAPPAAPGRIPAAVPRPPATVISSQALTVERAVEMLQDPEGGVGRMPIFRLLAMVRDVGPAGARELLRDARMTESRFVNSIPFRERVFLAGALRNRTGARI